MQDLVYGLPRMHLLLGTWVNKRLLTSTLSYQVDQAGYGPVGILRTCLPHLWPHSLGAQAGTASKSKLPVLPNEVLTEAVVLFLLHQHEPLLLVDVTGGV